MGRGPSIEGRKNAEDAKRAKVFTKLIREITIAARGGGDPAANARLRMAIDKALSSNMSKDTIERAVKRGSGAEGADDMQELRYEGYGPGGVALIIDAMTDNPVRTVAEVRHALSKNGGNLGTSGSVAFQFARVGEFEFDTWCEGRAGAHVEAQVQMTGIPQTTRFDSALFVSCESHRIALFPAAERAIVLYATKCWRESRKLCSTSTTAQGERYFWWTSDVR
jgi:YebC/PmpR family DNA-binding regulatory protein